MNQERKRINRGGAWGGEPALIFEEVGARGSRTRGIFEKKAKRGNLQGYTPTRRDRIEEGEETQKRSQYCPMVFYTCSGNRNLPGDPSTKRG